MKKAIATALALALCGAALSGCGEKSYGAPISVISREDGSGTRGAFIELFGIEEKNGAGEKEDCTTVEASITNSTSVMIMSVAGDEGAIGYISLGSLSGAVRALSIDGVEATVENIKNGGYQIARPYHIATGARVGELAQDFIGYIQSADGQAVVEASGYIAAGARGAYVQSGQQGRLVVAGSSSVAPVMEKLKEAYIAVNPGVTIEIQQSDSTTGMTSAIEGICDIGMASRELKDSERKKGLTSTVIAIDGIAVIVNNANPVENLDSETVREIFTGAVTSWTELPSTQETRVPDAAEAIWIQQHMNRESGVLP